MKHSSKIIVLLLLMFLTAQLIGLAVTDSYTPKYEVQIINNTEQNVTINPLPYGMEPPENLNPTTNLFSIIIAIIFAVVLMFILMKFRIELFIRLWFFAVIVLALGITLNSIFMKTSLASSQVNLSLLTLSLSSFISILIALPLAFLKIFRRNTLIHNLTELMIYPGIAVIFIPLLNIWTVIALFVFISIYDIYAVWHTGFMQKMAKYQIKKLKVFSGFFVPYLGKKEMDIIKSAQRNNKLGKLKNKKIKVNVAILGGGDVVFPIILAGVVLRASGILSALIVTFGALLGLLYLFYISEKGKFYPAMPFITAGCFIALALAYLL